MKEIYSTSSPAEISVIQNLLNGHDIQSFVFDRHSNAYPGLSWGIPKLMVIDEDYDQAVQIIKEAGLGKAEK